MSAAPQETAPALAVVPDPAGGPAAPPSLAQLLTRRTAAPQSHRPAQAGPRIVPPATSQARPQVPVQDPRAAGPLGGRQAPAGGMRALREPSFDELVTGYGRHRGPQERQAPASLLRRLALRARLLPTPARRPPARATGNS